MSTVDLNALIELQSISSDSLYIGSSSKQSSSVNDWSDEIGVLYASLLADVVILGSTSAIRRHALIGYESVEEYIGGSSSRVYTKDRKPASHLVGLTVLDQRLRGIVMISI